MQQQRDLLLYARDRYNNIVSHTSIAGRVTSVTISPSDVPWDAKVENVSNAAASIKVR